MIENKKPEEVRAYDAELEMVPRSAAHNSPVAATAQSVGTDSLMAAFGMRR